MLKPRITKRIPILIEGMYSKFSNLITIDIDGRVFVEYFSETEENDKSLTEGGGTFMEKVYTISQFSDMINIKVKTLQKWDRDGILKAKRTLTNRRYYTEGQYLSYIGESKTEEKRKTVIYARVSNKNQKDDLKNQITFISNYLVNNGIPVNETIQDIGSGLNYKRINWNDLLGECFEGKVSDIYISHKDRFVRFGFDWFSSFLSKYCGVTIHVLENRVLSPDEELVADLISIIHVFSCRIYGLRKYKKKIEKDDSL